MKVHYFILVILFLGSCSQKKQEKLSESIFTSKNYTSLSSDKKELFLDSIVKKRDTFPIRVSVANFLLDLSTEYYYLNKARKSQNICIQALHLSKELKDSLLIAKSYNYIGDTYNQTYRDSAYTYYQEAEKLYRRMGNHELLANMLYKKAYILFYEGNYIESEIKLSQALQLIKSGKDFEMLYMTYNLMGCNLDKLGDYDVALKYFEKAADELGYLTKNGMSENLIFDYEVTLSVNKANVFDKGGQYKKSINELSTILAKSKYNNNKKNYIILLGNLGYSKMRSGDLKGAEILLIRALNLTFKNGNEADAINKLINLGELKLIKKDTIKSRLFLSKALVLCKKLKASNELKLVYGLLSKVEPKQDSYYKEKIIQLTDSLAIVQRNNHNKYARIEYETSVVEDANKELSTRNLYLIAGILLLTSTLVIRYVISQRKEIAYRKQLQAAELELFDLMRTSQIELSVARNDEKNRISRELHDNVMNRLYGTRLHLGILNSDVSIGAEEKRSEHIDELQMIEKDIRSISHNLHTDSIAYRFDYPVLLSSCVQKAHVGTNTTFSFESDSVIDWESISGLVKIAIYRIVQEAVLNVAKYAEASTCIVKLVQPYPTLLFLSITDNGKGFDQNQVIEGIGLKNMKSRVQSLNGKFNVYSSPYNGTSIECQFEIK